MLLLRIFYNLLSEVKYATLYKRVILLLLCMSKGLLLRDVGQESFFVHDLVGPVLFKTQISAVTTVDVRSMGGSHAGVGWTVTSFKSQEKG